MGNLKTTVLYLPRPASKYPGCYPLHFEKHLKDILETTNYVHLFAGSAITGFRIDICPEIAPDLICDVHSIPLADESFDGAMADPPYTPKFAHDLYDTEYPKWSVWTKEMVRLVRPGRRIAVMQNYIVPRLHGCIVEEIIVILLRIKQYPKIVTVQRKRG